MCSVCRRSICVCGCPAYAERRPRVFCTVCGESGFEEYESYGVRVICADCVRDLELEGILRFFGLSDRTALYEALGAVRRRRNAEDGND